MIAAKKTLARPWSKCLKTILSCLTPCLTPHFQKAGIREGPWSFREGHREGKLTLHFPLHPWSSVKIPWSITWRVRRVSGQRGKKKDQTRCRIMAGITAEVFTPVPWSSREDSVKHLPPPLANSGSGPKSQLLQLSATLAMINAPFLPRGKKG